MSGSLSHKARAEPNLTPILDMVFQLITFFMLVINFKANQNDQQMELPIVGTAKPIDSKDHGPALFMMVNLNDKGEFTVYNRPIPENEIPNYIASEAQANRLAARKQNPNFDEKDDLPTTVIIRADKKTSFSQLSRILKLCQDNGFRNFAFRAMNKKKNT
jgi:biopolymer transport protein ExbD